MNDKPIQVYFRTLERVEENTPQRPEWFSYEKCFSNLLQTMNPELVDLNVIIDKPSIEPSEDIDYRVETINSDERLESL